MTKTASLMARSRIVSLIILLSIVADGDHGIAQPPQPGDYSPATYSVDVERDLDAPMRDGVKLKIDVFRPKAKGRVSRDIAADSLQQERAGQAGGEFCGPWLRGRQRRFTRPI